MKSSIFIFGTDLLHEGYDEVITTLKERGSIDGMALSATYHNARDIFPHNPKHRVYRHEGDIAWFKPEAQRYESGLMPRLAAAADGVDVLSELCKRGEHYGMPVSAWTIFLHNSRLGTAHPECASENLYGDRYLTDLCPANPRVQSYCRELAVDISRYPIQKLVAESLHYRTLEHGEHHERYLIDLPAEARTLMSLCFCSHCRAAGEAAGVAVDDLVSALQDALQPIWTGNQSKIADGALIRDDVRRELATFVEMRQRVITRLTADVRDAMSGSGVGFSFMDHTGAMSHVLPGTDANDDAALISAKLGIDPVAISTECDELCVLGYTDTAERLEKMLARYKALLGTEHKFSVALRPLLPDTCQEENFSAKVAAVCNSGAGEVGFYHYAMMPLDRLDWIRRALISAPDEQQAAIEQENRL